MSKPPRKVDTDGNSSPNFQNTLDTMRNVRERTTGSDGYLTKQLEAHTESMVNILKRHFGTVKAETNATDNALVKAKSTQHVSKMYTNVYKGTYQGIIDGLAKSKENERLQKIEQERERTSKLLIKSSAKNIIAFPDKFRRGLINLFAFERSEIFSTYRAIRHSVGIDEKGGVDYQQRLFRVMLEERSKSQGSITPQSMFAVQVDKIDTQIDLLTQIRDATAFDAERSNKFAQFFLGNKDSQQTALLKNIERNTDSGAQGVTDVRARLTKFAPILGMVGGLIPSIGAVGGGIAALPIGIGVILGGVFKKYATAFRSTEAEQLLISKESLKLDKQLVSATENADDQTGFFGLGKQSEDQIKILRDIRTSVSPKAQEKTGLAKLWHNFTKVPIGDLFKKQEKMQKTDSEKTVELLESVHEELQYNSDWTEMTYNLLANGIGVRPILSEPLTPFENANLTKLELIETANIEEIDAIDSLKAGICACLARYSKADDYDASAMIGAEERANEPPILQLVKVNTEIRDLIKMQANGADVVVGKTMLESAKGMLAMAGDASEVLQGTKDLKDMVFGNGKKGGNVVSLSDATMDRFEDILDDDSILDPLKRRRKGRGGKVIKGNFPQRGGRTPDLLPDTPKAKKKLGETLKGIFSKGKNLGGKVLSGGKGLIGKGVGLAASTVPVMTGGMGLTGLMGATGTGIASAGAGAMAGAAGLVGAAGAAGYGIGTLLNKGINAGMSKLTGGENTSLGGWLYDITHKKEIAAQKAQDEKFKKMQAERLAKQKAKEAKSLADQKAAKLEMEKNYHPPIIPVPVPVKKAEVAKIVKTESATMAEIGKIFGKVQEKVSGIEGVNMDGVLAKGAAGMSIATGVANQIMEKAQGIEVGRTLTAIYDKTETSRMELMADMKEMMNVANGSQTVQAIKESVSDVKNVVQGSTTNISVPVSPHDTDRNTNVMNGAYGA